MTDIKTFGAVGDGVHDDSAAFNKAVRDCRDIYIPEGTYLLGDTWRLPSHTHITAEAGAHILRKAHTQTGRRDFLLTNGDEENGNEDISISGGIWDGNCMEEDRGTDLFDETATTGVLFNFRHVRSVSLQNMTVKNPLCYYFRFCEAEGVHMEDIRFLSDRIIANQDGIHFAGFCKDFTIRNLWGSRGSPNDDFLAFNADDALWRQESFDVINGPIENITAENIHSDKCHCFVRFLSVESPIRNVTVRHVSGACKGVAVCMDAARYCRVPLFKESEYPDGVGQIENVSVEDLQVSHEDDLDAPFVTLETNCKNFAVKEFQNTGEPGAKFVSVRNTDTHEITLEGNKKINLPHREGFDLVTDAVIGFQFERRSAK